MKAILKAVILLLVLSACEKTSTDFTNNPNAPDYLHNRATGASANELLSTSKYNSLKVEILYMPGYAPDAGAVSNLQNFLNTLLNKPSGISIVSKEIPAALANNLSINDVFQIEKNNRSSFTSGNQIAVAVIYTNGYYTDQHTLGAAYRNTSVVLFGKNIHDNSGGLGQASRTKLESTVLQHEFGHLLGLIDLGSPMQTQHKDPAHGSHCNNSNCLMYYASDTRDILGFLITGNIPSLDANCRADLTANGGK
jgi:hypothetical protein